MSLGNVNAKILIEKAVQDYYRYQIKIRPHTDEKVFVRRIAAFDMHYSDGLSISEIAKELDVSVSLVPVDIAKVVSYLKWYMTKRNINNVTDALQ